MNTIDAFIKPNVIFPPQSSKKNIDIRSDFKHKCVCKVVCIDILTQERRFAHKVAHCHRAR